MADADAKTGVPGGDFVFDLKQQVQVSSMETGHVSGRAQYVAASNQYLVRYVDGSGCFVENWFPEDHLVSATT